MTIHKLVTMREALSNPGYFGTLLGSESWRAWRILLIAIVGEPLTPDERVIFTALTGRERETFSIASMIQNEQLAPDNIRARNYCRRDKREAAIS